jgi:hypothetical protein
VHDEVADFQVAEIRQERAARGSTPFVRPPLFFKEIGLRKQTQVCRRQMEALRQPAGRDEDGGGFKRLGVGDGARPDFVVGQQFDRALSSARASPP